MEGIEVLVNDLDKITEEQITNEYSDTANIEFLRYYDYDEYCLLCNGILELSINGQKYSFSSRRTSDLKNFFYPTVCFANGDYKRSSYTSWYTDVNELPDELKPFAKAIDEVININMPTTICRGCD